MTGTSSSAVYGLGLSVFRSTLPSTSFSAIDRQGRRRPRRVVSSYRTSTYDDEVFDLYVCTAMKSRYNTCMNEEKKCVECGESEVYLIDNEICQDCDDALYDDAF